MRYHYALTGLIVAISVSSQVNAQEAATPAETGTQDEASSSNGIEDIVVVAQKRSERLQDVPIAVSAVTADGLTKAGVDNVYELGQSVPGLVASRTFGTGSLVVSLRGVGATVASAGYENSVALYLDGVYSTSTNGSILRINNIERVEVLKGPQGTLFGRNATGGVISIITRDPRQEFSGNAQLSYDSYRTIEGNLYATTGLAPEAAIDFGATIKSQGKAYGRNLAYVDEDYQKIDYEYAVRSKLLLTPTETTKIRIIGDYARTKTDLGFAVPVPKSPFKGRFYTPLPGPFDGSINANGGRRWHGGGLSAQLDQEIGSLKLVNVLAWRDSLTTLELDTDQSAVPAQVVFTRQYDRQLSNELRLESPSDRALTWLLGAYYLRYDSGYDPFTITSGPQIAPLPTSVAHVFFDAGQLSKSYAGFGQSSLLLGEGTTFTVGLRYSSDRARRYGTQIVTLRNGVKTPGGTANLPASAKFDKLTWRVSLDHKFDDRTLAYASINRGFKSGGFNPNSSSDKIPYLPETLDAYEIGVKSDPIPGVLRANVAAYYYNYKNPQLQVVVSSVAYTRNAPKATIYGIDAEFNIVPTEGLRLDLGLSWAHARFGSFRTAPFYLGCPVGAALPCAGDATGNRLPAVPDFTATGSINYEIPLASGGKIELNGNVSFQSSTPHDPAETYIEPAFTTAKASITWHLPGDRLRIRAYVDNITDNLAFRRIGFSGLAGASGVRSDPRTFGLSVGAVF